MSEYLNIDEYTQYFAEQSNDLSTSRGVTLSTLHIGLGNYDKATDILESGEQTAFSLYYLSLIEELKGNKNEAMALRKKAAKAESPEAIMQLLPSAESLQEWRALEEVTQSVVDATEENDELYLINQFADFNTPAEEVDADTIKATINSVIKQKSICSDILTKIRSYKAELETRWQQRDTQAKIKSEAEALKQAKDNAVLAEKRATKALTSAINHAKTARVNENQAELSAANAAKKAKAEIATIEAAKQANIAKNMADNAVKAIQAVEEKKKLTINAKRNALAATISTDAATAAQIAQKEADAAEAAADVARNAAESAKTAAQKAEKYTNKAIADAQARALANRHKFWRKLYIISQFTHSALWILAIVTITALSYAQRANMSANIELTIMAAACIAVYVIRLKVIQEHRHTKYHESISTPIFGVCSCLSDFLWLPLFAAPAFTLFATSMSEVSMLTDIAGVIAFIVCLAVGSAVMMCTDEYKITASIVSIILLFVIKYIITSYDILSSNGCLCLPLFLLLMVALVASINHYVYKKKDDFFTPEINMVLTRPFVALFFVYMTGLLLGRLGNPFYQFNLAYETIYNVFTSL